MEEYDASLQNICTVDSVQLFWQCFNNLPTVDQLKPKSSFHLMKVRPVLARVLNVQAGIKPIWEDPNNENGGFWAMRVKKEDTYVTRTPTRPAHSLSARSLGASCFWRASASSLRRCCPRATTSAALL